MDKQRSNSRIDTLLTSFFEKSLNALKPPFMKLTVLLVYSILIVYIRQEEPNRFSLLLVIIAIVFLATLTAILEYADKRLRYSQKTEEKLKGTLREIVWERQKELHLIQVIDEYFVSDLELLELRQRFHQVFPNYLTDYDDLSSQGKKLAMICGLVNYCHRRGIVEQLAEIVHLLRPHVRI